MDFKIGDTIVYGTQGVCKISGTEQKSFGSATMDYYILEPVYSKNSVIYVPTKNEKLLSKMRRVLSSEEIYSLIREMPNQEVIWIEDESKRKEEYKKWLASGDRVNLVRGIKAVYLHWQEVMKSGKKLHIADEKFLKEAEKLLYNEFAMVLNIDPDQVLPFITEQIEVEIKLK